MSATATRTQLADADAGMLGLAAYVLVLVAVNAPVPLRMSVDDLGAAMVTALVAAAVRIVPLYVYMFFCLKRAFFAFRAAVEDGHRVIAAAFGLFLGLSWLPILGGSAGSFTVAVAAPDPGEEPLLLSVYETVAAVARFMAHGALPAFCLLGAWWLASLAVSIVAREHEPYYKMDRMLEREQRRRLDADLGPKFRLKL